MSTQYNKKNKSNFKKKFPNKKGSSHKTGNKHSKSYGKNNPHNKTKSKKYNKTKTDKRSQYAEITVGGSKYSKTSSNDQNTSNKHQNLPSSSINHIANDQNIVILFPHNKKIRKDPFGDDLFTNLQSSYIPAQHSNLTVWTLVRWGIPSKVTLMPFENDTIFRKNEKVIIDTEKGLFLGKVVKDSIRKNEKPIDNPRKIIRKANEKDLQIESEHQKLAEEAIIFAKQRIEALGMEMKLFHTLVTHNGNTILFYFTANGRVDFRKLVRNLAAKFSRRIEMRQMGVRDDAKILGGLGHCGRELCCQSYLTKFIPVSIKMAKDQNLVLNPHNVSGQCGRLKCCLAYEQDFYMEIRKQAPRIGKKLETPKGVGTVLEVNYFSQKAKVALSEKESEYFNFSELKN